MKQQESGYCDEARLTCNYYFSMTFWSSVYMRTQPLSYKWACPNFNNKPNLGSWNFLEFKGGVDTREGFW